MRKLRHSEMKQLAHGHTATKGKVEASPVTSTFYCFSHTGKKVAALRGATALQLT